MTPSPSCFVVPKDFDRWLEFRSFVTVLSNMQIQGPKSLAYHVFFTLWVELAYCADRNRLACIPKTELPIWFRDLDQTDLDYDNCVNALLLSKIIREDADDYFCLMFFEHNEHLFYGNRGITGGEAVAVSQKKKRADIQSEVKAAGLHPDRYQEVDGERITPDEMRKILVMVDVSDSILARHERRSEDYTPAVIRDGCAILRKYGSKNIDVIMVRLMQHRGSEHVPRNTERLFATFDRVIKLIEPEEGWGHWSLVIRESQKLDADASGV